ncbi:hypothetical protein HYFRA_00006486 [Hymenoscyphus fraxineus]|uniref:PLC-like phosphodiesterase n=1 Tax=Hymenoscyphus fraxineus TaxID=746836 RepID=A0A9N9KQW6_9HELO|nr:hypothetical protein HYFRA_00006486 [Hymenoscyphus fraxineus]
MMQLWRIFVWFFFFIGSTKGEGCNGSPALCDQKYSKVSQIGTHDSAFVGELPSDNQELSVTDQLNRGIRMLQAQTHDFLDQIQMCHTSCVLLNAGSLLSYLTTIRTWMDANPNEVVTLLLTNQDAIDVADYNSVFVRADLEKYTFKPKTRLAIDDWPTLQELITANTRLVVFMDYHADTARVPYILDEFQYFSETSYEVTDENFPSCDIDRPSGSTDNLMLIVNHMLHIDIFGIMIPDRGNLERTNAATGPGSIGAQVDVCKRKWGRKPRLVLVDFFNTGDVFTAQTNLNS